MIKPELYFNPDIIDSLVWVEFFARKLPQTKSAMEEFVRTFTVEDTMWDFDNRLHKKHGISFETFQRNRRNLVIKNILILTNYQVEKNRE